MADRAEHIDPDRAEAGGAERIEPFCRQLHAAGILVERKIQVVRDGLEQTHLIHDAPMFVQQRQQLREGVVGFPLR